MENQKPQIVRSLKLAVQIFKECNASYRVVGSMLVTSYIHRIFRRVGDLDVLLDRRSYPCILYKLKKSGYTLEKKYWSVFRWIEAEKKDCLGFTFLLVGEFNKSHFQYIIFPHCELRIRLDYLQPTNYSFEGINFIGIPLSSVKAGLQQAFLNPKRKRDKQMLQLHKDKINSYQTYNNIQVSIFGITIPYLYDVFSFFYNIYGGFRVVLGKKYETWE
ncbi:MAG: hypothetical protein UW78_C0018G0004 [Candidatus Azambacteria bacterium GW2011_GWA1_44_9]|uniref:Uncharacterized protein n=1 Tax=Candidatus Azambacteria bacterium GW2011_GWA1_44_9 TaxID=1618610 RepID=A0A0G1NA30_9BACT|nr:MAG: hypothetical protein UW78_C0018G0004 [Candidatus Azambacteria bacterium GW2011_GWA1_44_9]